jgi:hypothetical protein
MRLRSQYEEKLQFAKEVGGGELGYSPTVYCGIVFCFLFHISRVYILDGRTSMLPETVHDLLQSFQAHTWTEPKITPVPLIPHYFRPLNKPRINI